MLVNRLRSEPDAAEEIKAAVAECDRSAQARRSLQILAGITGSLFAAAAAYLEAEAGTPGEKFLATLLLRQECTFERLTDPARCSSRTPSSSSNAFSRSIPRRTSDWRGCCRAGPTRRAQVSAMERY